MDSDSMSDPGPDDAHTKVICLLPIKYRCKTDDCIDLCELYFSNEEYYRKLRQLRRAHRRTMADLELVSLKKPELKDTARLNNDDRGNRLPCHQTNSTTVKLKKARSSHELRSSAYMDEVHCTRYDHIDQNVSIELLNSPKERIKNMWRGFLVDKMPPGKQEPSSALLQNRPGDRQDTEKPNDMARYQRSKKGKRSKEQGCRPQVTVPKPFQMTLREADYKCKRFRCRSEIEWENEKLRRELKELKECQRKFRATAVPAHVRLPLYEELQERGEERRQQLRKAEQQRLLASQRPFSFLERENIKKQQKDLQMLLSTKEQKEQRRHQIFRAKPVPRAVKEAASGELQKEEQLYREIRKEMRATEMLLNASEPPSILARRLSERRTRREDQSFSTTNHNNRFTSQVPDFNASYRRFQKQLASKREFRPLTACKPFKLCTANISSCKEHHKANTEVERRSQSTPKCRFVSPSPQTPLSSTFSSFSGSHEYQTCKITGGAEKRQEAIRNVLEQKKKAELEEEKWKERQRQKERKLQKLIAMRAQANDPHVALAQICQSKLKEFRKQDLQRCREYQEEIREIHERVKSRPLLLEQVTQMNAKMSAEKQYTEALRAFGLSVAFVNSKAPTSEHSDTLLGHPVIRTPLPHRKDRTVDHLGDDDFEDRLPTDYPADYEDYIQDMEDVPMHRKNERQQTDEGENLDKERDPDGDGHSSHSYEDDQDFDDYNDKDGDKSDEGCGDRGHGRHSNTIRVSDEATRNTSPLKDRGRKEDRKSRLGSRETVSDEETEGGQDNDED